MQNYFTFSPCRPKMTKSANKKRSTMFTRHNFINIKAIVLNFLVLFLVGNNLFGQTIENSYNVNQQIPIGGSGLYYVQISGAPSNAVITNVETKFGYIAYGVVQNYVSCRFNRGSDPGSSGGVSLVSQGSLPAANPGTYGYISFSNWNGQSVNTNYYFRFNVASGSPYTATINTIYVRVTYALPPNPPSLISPADYSIYNRNNTTSITFQWTSVSGALEYWLNVFPSGSSSTPVFNGSVGNTISYSLNPSGWSNNVYIWQVKVRTIGGWSNYSSQRQFIADRPPVPPPLSSPSNNAGLNIGTTQNFTWSAPPPPDNAARYTFRIVSGTNINNSAIIHEETFGTSRSVTFSSPTWSPGTYTWGVRAIKQTPAGYNQTTYENTIGWGQYAIRTFSLTTSNAAEKFAYPVDSPVVSQNYDNPYPGRGHHTGIDYDDASGLNIKASASGIVAYIMTLDGNDHGMGNCVIIEHKLTSGGTIYSLYAHLNSIASGISVGSIVTKGQFIGVMGGSGYTSLNYWPTHLHFEIKDSAVLENPSGSGGPYWGYTPTSANNYGYHNPADYIGIIDVSPPCQMTSINVGQTVNGTLSTSDCRSPVRGSSYYADRYSFNATLGQQVSILLTSSAFDTYLYLLGPSGSVLTENDDGGGGTNSRIPPGSGFYSLPSSGTYIIEVTSYYQNATGAYTLSLSAPTSCNYSISPTSRSHGSGAETGTVSVTAPSGCGWTASSNASWITITSGSSGSGNGTVSYSIATNTNANSRTGTLTIAGQTFTVTQAGSVVTIFFDNMENGITGWAFNFPWAQTTTSSYSPTHSWTDSPSGNYGNNVNVSLWSPSINLSGQTGATLTFFHRYDLESNYDFGRVWITTNNGVSYTLLASFTATQLSWVQTSINISAYVGNPSVKITFQLFTDGSVVRDGWYIDDVKISSGSGTLSLTRASSQNDLPNLPKDFRLYDNFPNPFNPSTTIRYAIPAIGNLDVDITPPNVDGKNDQASDHEKQVTRVKLLVFDVLGQLVRVLVDEEQKPGFYEVQWNGKNAKGETVGSGVYLYSIVAGNFKVTKRMILIK